MKQRFTADRQALQQVELKPVFDELTGDGTLFLDFGKAAFGTLLLPTGGTELQQAAITVHLAEQLTPEGRVNREPDGTIRYIRIEQAGQEAAVDGLIRLVIPRDERNTGPAAITMPAHIGEVFPFRYAEIENATHMDVADIRQLCVFYPFNDESASFSSSNDTLDAVWELCKYSIKATTFCGVYVDGDRERIPYEGDAYINQLSHYGVDNEYTLARYTHEYLIQNPTWPTEWQLHSVMMAWADYLYSGELTSLDAFYDDLCAKTLIDLARDDGLISTLSEKCTEAFERRLHLHGDTYIFNHGLRDLVDWPPGSFTDGGTGERDNYEMLAINTVINAFHCHALALMSRIADALGRSGDQKRFGQQSERVKASLNALLFDHDRGVYVDGEGATHASLHSNMFMLAFELVPRERQASVVSFVKSRGMACSVYGAQYLLEALYLHGEDQYALELMTARTDRSWWNMINLGSTMTLEAWDLKYKNNLDWNHAWGACPANIVPRYLLGVRPLEPGFKRVLIQPQTGDLATVSGRVPTPHGAVDLALQLLEYNHYRLNVVIPAGIEALVRLPRLRCETLKHNGLNVARRLEGVYVDIDSVMPGAHEFVYSAG